MLLLRISLFCLFFATPAFSKDREIIPEPVSAETFSALTEHSPFARSVGLSDSIVLTGVARIEDRLFATLVDTETAETHLVTDTANSLGWQLVEVSGDEADLESLTARVLTAGGDQVSIRYDKAASEAALKRSGKTSSGGGGPKLNSGQLKEAKWAAENYRKGFSADGYPREPPPEVVQKLSRMSSQQREALNRRMIDLRNRGLGMEERRKIYNESINRTLGGGR